MRNFHGYRARFYFLTVPASVLLMACANSIPPSFQYETSVRGERGLEGTFGRQKVVTALLEAGVVKDPEIALQQALPGADISVRKWGLRYFPKDWVRYQVMLNADISDGDEFVKCRGVSTEGPVGAPTLPELLANDGAQLQQELDGLITACLAQFKDLT